jgi:hypothetical protein
MGKQPMYVDCAFSVLKIEKEKKGQRQVTYNFFLLIIGIKDNMLLNI